MAYGQIGATILRAFRRGKIGARRGTRKFRRRYGENFPDRRDFQDVAKIGGAALGLKLGAVGGVGLYAWARKRRKKKR